jgi:transketolase
MAYKLGEAQVLFDNTSSFEKNVTLIASGSMVVQAFAAVPQLEAKKMGCIIVNPSIHNRPDLKTISAAIEKTKGRHIFIEDHQKIGGLAHLVGAELYKQHSAIKVRALGVDQEFGQSAYNAIELYEKHHIDSGAIVRNAIELA